MGIPELFLLALGLSMDAFAVSISKGLITHSPGACALCGIWFGGFQGLMPLMGYLLGSAFSGFIGSVDYLIVFAVLTAIGGKMVKDGISGQERCPGGELSPAVMLPLALATSMDAMAVGVSLAMAGGTQILFASLLICGVTFVMSAAGVKLGSFFGSCCQKTAQILGGSILILLGVKILLEKTGVL